MINIEELRADIEAGTPGPWSVNPFRAQVDAQKIGLFGELLPVCQLLWPTDERSENETSVNARRLARLPQLERDYLAMREALEGLIDDEPCWKDHHGYCQAHGLNDPCEMQVARDILTKTKGE